MSNNYKYAVGVTWYNPSFENVQQTIRYTQCFDYVFVYDNSPYGVNNADCFVNVNNVIYIRKPLNDGLPVAFNCIMKKCYEMNIDFLCTMDQDSLFRDIDIEHMKNNCILMVDSAVGIIAAEPIDLGTNLQRPDYIPNIKKVSWVICSGSFIDVKKIMNKGILYDEAYFVDKFDADFSMEVRRSGLDILVDKNVQFEHACGDDKHFHSRLRNYYIFRNRYYYNKKYYGIIERMFRNVLQSVRQIYQIILHDGDKIGKMRAFIVGTQDYLKNDMCKISDESLLKLNR